jgi:predicted unusual protein kinase regulating ubiquinone biosynthesis (AarF/ABC1/UbiB family)
MKTFLDIFGDSSELIKKYKIKTLVEEFERSLNKELDYEIEGASIRNFTKISREIKT